MAETLVTAATEDPVSLSDIKLHCRITHNDEDELLLQLVGAATRHVESHLNQQLVTATWRLTLLGFPHCEIIVPRPPLIAVSSITYVDTAGTTTTLSASNYQVDASAKPGRIMPAYSLFWPDTRYETYIAVTINYTAGYGAAEDVPLPIRQAIKLLAAHWYQNRESVLVGTISSELPMAVRSLLAGEWMGNWMT